MTETAFHYIGTQAFANPNPNAVVDVVFVHGLGGNASSTWSFTSKEDGYWPKWLAADLPIANIWAVEYEASALAGPLSGGGSSIRDTASMLVDFAIARSFGARPLVFITHSLGGLVVKQMLRLCADSTKSDYRALLSATKGVVFLATPHYGATLASTVSSILSIATSNKVTGLAYGRDQLIDLGEWFSGWANDNSIAVAAYFETKKTKGMHIVDKVTADPRVAGCTPVAIEADHTAICKPSNQEAHAYSTVLHFIKGVASPPQSPASLTPNAALFPSSAPLGFANGSSIARENTILLAADFPRAADVDVTTAASPSGLSSEFATDYELYTTEAAGNRKSLETKLADGKRSHEIGRAMQLKERFAKALHRHIAQPSSLTGYVLLLSEVATRFNRTAYPAILAGASSSIVNGLIQRDVIDAALDRLSPGEYGMTPNSAEGALYYLTGNCHVRWDDGTEA